jgi:CRP-like cAMP-binding protein
MRFTDAPAVLTSALGPPVDVGPRNVLFRQGAPAAAVYYIVDGHLNETTSRLGGHGVLLRLLGPGCFVAVAPALLGTHYCSTARTVDACRIRVLRSRDFRYLYECHAAVSRWAASALARSIPQHAAAAGRFGHDSAARLETIFADLVRAGSTRMPDGSLRISLTVTQDVLVNAICTSREYLSRLIRTLESTGDLKRHKRWYLVPRNSRILSLLDSSEQTFHTPLHV